MVCRQLLHVAPLEKDAQVILHMRQTVGTHGARLVIFRVWYHLEHFRIDLDVIVFMTDKLAELHKELHGERVDGIAEEHILLNQHLVGLKPLKTLTQTDIVLTACLAHDTAVDELVEGLENESPFVMSTTDFLFSRVFSLIPKKVCTLSFSHLL